MKLWIWLVIVGVVYSISFAQPKPKSWKDVAIEALLAGDRAKAIEYYRKWMEADPGDHISLYNLACAYALSDSIDRAVEAMRASVAAGWSDSNHTVNDPDLKSLRPHPEFRSILSEAARNARLRAGGFTEHFFAQERMGRYLVVLPDEYDPSQRYPLVMMLHGHGQNAVHFAEVAHLLNSVNFIYAVPEGPYVAAETEGNGFSHFRETENYADDPATVDESTRWVLGVAADMRKRYNISGEKFWMVGYSQGGALAHAVAATYPDSVAGYAVHGAYFVPHSIDEQDLKRMKDAGVKVMITHGSNDLAVGPEEAVYAHNAFKQIGIAVELNLLESQGHAFDVTARMKIDEWLRTHAVK